MRLRKINSFSIVIGLFLVTLQSIHLPIVGSVFTYIGLIILLCVWVVDAELDKVLFKRFGWASILIWIALALQSMFMAISLADFKSILATTVMLLSVAPLVALSENHRDSVHRAVTIVVGVHSGLLILQVIVWAISRDYLDLYQFVTGDVSGYSSAKGLVLGGQRVPRFTGLFNEPGTYSVIVGSCCFVLLQMSRTTSLVLCVGLATICFTMSMFGLIIVTVVCIFLPAPSKLQKAAKLYVVGMFAYIGLMLGVKGSVEDRFASDYSGLDLRMRMIQDHFSGSLNLILGRSVEGIPYYYVKNDLGLFFAFNLSFGIFGIVICLLCFERLYRRRKGLRSYIALILMLSVKLKFSYPLFWLLFSLLIMRERKTEESA